MAIPIISTKLHVPKLPKALVPRPRLIDRLKAGARGKLILVSAPAGFGKTSLIAEWVNQCMGDCLVSWLHLDDSDNELIRFLSYLIAALQIHQKDLGEAALSGLQSMPPVPIEAALTSLINEIDSLQGDQILIFDDYHLIENASIHQAVGFLIEHLPAQMCLVIATRIDPPLPLHRLRARGEMTEIREQELRFSREETRSLLEGILQAKLSPGDITVLENRLEGWAAGLQMVALSMQGRQDVHQFIASFSGSHRFIMDYLSEEIYNQQPPHIQKFLLKTSILERLSGPLCDYLLGENLGGQGEGQEIPPARETLEYLEHANLFLLPMDDERVWYRYHHLFANLLRQRLRQTWPEEIPDLQRRASDWFAAQGYFEEAFQYALAADDLQAAAQIVEEQGLSLLKEGAVANLSSWFNKLPAEMITERPWLSVIFSWILLLTRNPDLIEGYLSAAEQGANNLTDSAGLYGNIAAIRAYATAIGGNVEMAIEQAHKALELLPQTDLSTRSVVSFVLGGVYYLQGDMPGALEAMDEASQYGERSGNIHVAVSALSSQGGILISLGKLSEAEEIYRRGLNLGTSRSGRPLPITAGIYSGLARCSLARRDLQTAREFAHTGFELGEQWLNPDSQVNCLLTLAQVAQFEGNYPEAQQALEQAKHLAATYDLTPGTEPLIKNVESSIRAQKVGRASQGLLIGPLSERELEVLGLMAEGRSNPEIAAELIIALGTVKAHTSSIYRKLDARSRTEAVLRAKEIGLV
jgi:LuxR family maltose regulon positive regulatory protein